MQNTVLLIEQNMEMIECMQYIDKVKDNMLYYSASVNKPLLVRNRELRELPEDKIPVGKSYYKVH